jgi:WD40 repeat protein
MVSPLLLRPPQARGDASKTNVWGTTKQLPPASDHATTQTNGAKIPPSLSYVVTFGNRRNDPQGSLRILVHTWGKPFTARRGEAGIAYSKYDNVVVASAVSPDGHLVATGGGNNQGINIWDPRTGETKAVLKGTGTPPLPRPFRPMAARSPGAIPGSTSVTSPAIL